MGKEKPRTEFAITEAITNIVLGPPDAAEYTEFLREIMRCARETAPFFKVTEYARALLFTDWRRSKTEGDLVSPILSQGGGPVLLGRSFTARYQPREGDKHLSVGFYRPDQEKDGKVRTRILPLGGVLSPRILARLEDALSEAGGFRVSIPVLASPTWMPDPWRKTVIQMVCRQPDKQRQPDSKKRPDGFNNGVPVFLDTDSPAPPYGRLAPFTIMSEDARGVTVWYGEISDNVVVRSREFRTDEEVPPGFDYVKVYGLDLATTTDDEITEKMRTMFKTGPKADDAITLELASCGRQLDLSKPQDMALWKKAVRLGRGDVRSALRREAIKAKAAVATPAPADQPDSSGT